MKNKLSIVCVSFMCCMLLVFSSCEYEALQTNEQNTERTASSWSLATYTPSAFFPEQFQSFEEGQIVWDFDMDTQSLDISIEEVQKIESLPDIGSYQFELAEHVCNYGDNQYISIDGREYGLMITDYIDSDSLIITNACVDGHIMLFVR